MTVRTAALWSIGSQYAGFIVQFITSVLISRFFLGPNEYGLFTIALAAAMLVAVLQDFGLTRYIAKLEVVDAEHIATCSSIAILFSAGVAGIITALSWPAAWFYGEPSLTPVLIIVAASYLFVPFSVIPASLLSRTLNFKALFKVNVAGALVQGCVALGLAALGFSASSLAWAMVAQALTRAVVGQKLSPAMPPFPLKLSGWRPIVAFGSASSTLYIIGNVGTRAPDLIIGRVLGLTATGLFSRGYALADQFRMLLGGAIGAVFYPAFARMRERGEAMGDPYIRVVGGYTAIIWPGMAGLALSAYPLVHFLYGEQWVEAAPILAAIALSEILFIALPLTMDIPILCGRMKQLIRLSVLDTSASIVTLLIAVQFDVLTAAISRSVYAAIWLLLYFRLMHELIEFDIRALLKTYAKSAAVTLAAIAPLALGYALWLPMEQMPFIAVCGLAGVGACCWLGALYAVAHPAWAEVMAILTPLLARVGVTLPERAL